MGLCFGHWNRGEKLYFLSFSAEIQTSNMNTFGEKTKHHRGWAPLFLGLPLVVSQWNVAASWGEIQLFTVTLNSLRTWLSLLGASPQTKIEFVASVRKRVSGLASMRRSWRLYYRYFNTVILVVLNHISGDHLAAVLEAEEHTPLSRWTWVRFFPSHRERWPLVTLAPDNSVSSSDLQGYLHTHTHL